MLKGDLTSTPLAPLLRDLADDTATGCLHVTNPAGDEALIYLKNGLVYSATVPGTRPQLGAKLVSSGALAPEALAEALEAQRSELQGWRLGELLVHLGYVDQPVVEAFVREQVNEALWDLLRWVDGRWKFRKNIRAREDIGPPMVVVELLATLRDRGYEWENISAVVHGPAAVPVLSARGGGSAETTLDNDAWSMLCKIDGERSVADLARDCGYTLFEAGQVIVQLVQAGLVDIEEDVEIAGTELYGASTLTSALAGELDDDDPSDLDEDLAVGFDGRPTDAEKEDVMSRLARLVNEVAGDHSQDQATNGDRPPTDPDDLHSLTYEPTTSVPAVALAPALSSGVTSFENPMIVPLHRHSTESFAASIARVSNALSDVLGATPDLAEAEAGSSTKPVALKRSRGGSSDPEWQRRKRLRSAAAAELANAQAMVETLRADTDTDGVDADADAPIEPGEVVAEQIDEPDTEAVSVEQAEPEDFAAEQAEAERLAAEQAAAEQLAAEEVHAQAEQLAADEAAEVERQEAERVAAEQAEAARAAEAAEVAAIEAAERAALEELAWADYWEREGEARAAAEAERVAAEQAEAERVAAEQAEAERIAAEAEAERLAAEQAEQQAAAEAEAERLAAEQAEAERIAAEQEAERLAAEQAEAERVAAEEAEAERVAAEQAEIEHLAAEQAEAERVAAEQAEAERVAAEQAEAERLEAEQAEIERLEAEEAQRLAAEQAEADRLEAEEAEQQAAAQAEADRLAAEEAERVAAEQAAQEQAAAAEAERAAQVAERVAAEEAEEEQAARSAAEEKAERAARRKAEREEAEDAERQRDEAAAATAMLIELAASSQAEAAAAEPAEAPAEEVAADATSEETEAEAATEAWSEAGQADTAALLRELSSLGMDDDEPSAPTQQQRPRPNAVDKKTKKKIGLFGL